MDQLNTDYAGDDQIKTMNLEINHKTIYDYVEFSFCLPIKDLFYEQWDEIKPKPDGKEIMGVADLLKITFDQAQIEKDYWAETNNVEVYHSRADIEVFLLFDLIRDPYDQCDMIFLGVRVNRRDDQEIRDQLLVLYKKGNPRSNFEIDYFNQSLYRQVFGSDFYFYQKEQNKARKMNHHNLS